MLQDESEVFAPTESTCCQDDTISNERVAKRQRQDNVNEESVTLYAEVDEDGDQIPELCNSIDASSDLGPALLEKHGVFLIANVLCGEVFETVRRSAQDRVSEALQLFMVRQTLGRLGTEQFKEINCRDGGRFDIRHRMDEAPFPELALSGAWVPVVRRILGEDAKLLFCGVLLACSEGEEGVDQEWHTDGGHLFDDDCHLSCHCLNVFLPLVDLVEENGPTQFVLGSHQKGFLPEGEVGATSLICVAGTAILFDYRILHRGSANRTEVKRPCLYFTYAKPWFTDHKNLRSERSILEKD